MTRNLILCPIGNRSKHRTWLEGPGRPNFDLFLLDYTDGEPTAKQDAQYYFQRKGFKFEHLHFAATECSDILSQYDRIWCPDDDIACDTEGVNRLFDIFQRYRLQLAQPAIAQGEFSFKSLVQQRGNILRYTPYVEVMCPIFTQEAFRRVQDTFLENRSGWGLDWVWSKRFALHEMAIIDKVGVHHTGPLGKGEHYKSLAKIGINPFQDFKDTVARHGGIDWKLHRRMLRGRMRMKSIPDPDDQRSILMRISDYLRWLRLNRTSVCRAPESKAA